MNKNLIVAALFFYALAGFHYIQGRVYKHYKMGYGKQVAANGLYDILTSPLSLLTAWVPWQFWFALELTVGTYLLWLAFQPVKKTE